MLFPIIHSYEHLRLQSNIYSSWHVPTDDCPLTWWFLGNSCTLDCSLHSLIASEKRRKNLVNYWWALVCSNYSDITYCSHFFAEHFKINGQFFTKNVLSYSQKKNWYSHYFVFCPVTFKRRDCDFLQCTSQMNMMWVSVNPSVFKTFCLFVDLPQKSCISGQLEVP